jgi:hypothetical protein
MILELVEKMFQRIDSLALIDIDSEDASLLSKIQITAPSHRYLDGIYKTWKYGDHGYVWAKKVQNSSISYVLFFNNDPKDTDHRGPIRSKSDRYIYIYQLNPVRTSGSVQQIARCEISHQGGNEISKWYVQDQDTFMWNSTSSISYKMILPAT